MHAHKLKHNEAREKVKQTSVGTSLLNPDGFLDGFLVSGPRALPPTFFLRVHCSCLNKSSQAYYANVIENCMDLKSVHYG